MKERISALAAFLVLLGLLGVAGHFDHDTYMREQCHSMAQVGTQLPHQCWPYVEDQQ